MAMGVATLLRVSLLMATCAVWVIAEAQQEDDIIPEWLFANSGEEEEEATNIMISTRKPKPGWVKGGTSCLNSDECGRGKCCLRRNRSPRRRCRRFQRVGEPCTEEQMMGGYYYGHCPCNKNGVCTYTAKGLRCVRKKKEQQQELPPPQVPTQPPAIPPGLPPKEEEESEEAQGKPSGPAKPSQAENELPELAFEKLTGPGDINNAISPFLPESIGSRPSASNKPVAPAPGATSGNNFPGPAQTNPAAGFGQGGNDIVPVAGTPRHPSHPQLVTPPFETPNTFQGSTPPTSPQGGTIPSPNSPSATPGTNLLPQLETPGSSFRQPQLGSNGVLGSTGQQPQLPGLPQSPLRTGNRRLAPPPEQEPSQHRPSPPSIPPESNALPPIPNGDPIPPPLPPSPLEAPPAE